MATIYGSGFIASLLRHNAQIYSVWQVQVPEAEAALVAVFFEEMKYTDASPWNLPQVLLWDRDEGLTEAGKIWLKEKEGG